MADAYWPWYVGALALTAAPVLHLVLTGRPLGVSGAWSKVVNFRRERAAEAQAEALASDALLQQELLMATEAEFGRPASGSPPPTAKVPGPTASGGLAAPLGAVSSLLFLLSIAAGGALSAALRGHLLTGTGHGAAFEALFGTGGLMLGVLALGGVLVGFGTRLSGGCTSGHGLMGCSRLQPPSLLATMTFLGAAVAASLLLDKVLLP